jgi:SAM-dependent methyltransferase
VNEAERGRWNDERRARSWPKRERLTATLVPYLLRAAALRCGERVLDVGSGGGRSTIEAARAVGPDGLAVGADFSEPLTRLALERAAAAGVENVRFEVVDVQTDRVSGAPFAAAISLFGVMFYESPADAFANIRSHLEPGGRLVFVCWRSAQENPWFLGPSLAAFVPPPPAPDPGKSLPGPFSLADPERTTAVLGEAGFAGVRRTGHGVEVEGPEDAVLDDDQLALLGIPPERLPEARAAALEHLRPLRLPSGALRFPLAFQVFSAVSRGGPTRAR